MNESLQLVLVSGLSGSGKSIALNVLEDAGFYCVDNLPAAMLEALVFELRAAGNRQIAVAIDMRGGAGIDALPGILARLSDDTCLDLRFLFLHARPEVLIQRFSETRRRHPLTRDGKTLPEAIHLEIEALVPLTELGQRIDTSHLKPAVLAGFVRDFIADARRGGLTLLFESFGFKHGLPLDADLVFDVRVLPNPHYETALRPLTGRDAAVIAFIEAQPAALRMLADIRRFITDWLPEFQRDNRAYLTVAIGCTGGQHRSVYFAETLAREFIASPAAPRVLVRHRALT